MEIQHLPYKQGTYEDYLGLKGLDRMGIKRWRDSFINVVTRFITALELDDVVIGGGNVNKLDKLPPGCRAGDNSLAFRGGFLLWEKKDQGEKFPCTRSYSHSPRLDKRIISGRKTRRR